MTDIPSPNSSSFAEASACADASADTSADKPNPTLPETTEDTPIFTPDTPETYNPDDYRWVPVRRKPRYDGWTDEKQRRFIEELADTGIVAAAAKAVGMTRQSANRLRRSPDGAAFSRAWDLARQHAGTLLEDIAFERAIEGVEHHIFDEHGNVICTKRVVNDRLLKFLLGQLMPERYGRDVRQASLQAPETIEAGLRAMEPQLPAPVEELLELETLEDELVLAEVADGALPGFLSEQRPLKSDAQIADADFAAQLERGKAACEKLNRGEGPLTDQEFDDHCLYLDPTQRHERGKKRYK